MNRYVRRHSRRSVKCLIRRNSVQMARKLWRPRNVANLASKLGSVFDCIMFCVFKVSLALIMWCCLGWWSHMQLYKVIYLKAWNIGNASKVKIRLENVRLRFVNWILVMSGNGPTNSFKCKPVMLSYLWLSLLILCEKY